VKGTRFKCTPEMLAERGRATKGEGNVVPGGKTQLKTLFCPYYVDFRAPYQKYAGKAKLRVIIAKIFTTRLGKNLLGRKRTENDAECSL